MVLEGLKTETYITDERTGLKYELVGDHYLIAGENEPEERSIGVWGQRHLRYSNIDEYNHGTGEHLERYIFACDEIAEVLDKTGMDNARKKQIGQLETKLSTIARQGRAFGIHLILATSGLTPTSSTGRYGTIWTAASAAEPMRSCPRSFSETVTQLRRYQSTQEAGSCSMTVRCFKPIGLMKPIFHRGTA